MPETNQDYALSQLVDDMTLAHYDVTREQVDDELLKALRLFSTNVHDFRFVPAPDGRILEMQKNRWKGWQGLGYSFTASLATVNLLEHDIPSELVDDYTANLLSVLQKAGRFIPEESGVEMKCSPGLIYALRTSSPVLISLALWLTIKDVVAAA